MATEVVIPMLGVTVEKGKVVEWLKEENDSVEKGESIFVVEADKVTTEVESPATGVLAKILLPPGEEVPVLSVIAIITDPGEAVPAEYLGEGGRAKLAEPASAAEPVKTSSPVESTGVTGSTFSGPIKVVPAARKLAKDRAIALQSVCATGPGETITHKDVLTHKDTGKTEQSQNISTLARRKAEAEGVSLDGAQGTGVRGRVMVADLAGGKLPATQTLGQGRAAADFDPEFGKVIPMDGMRSTIAKRLTSSAFTAPHVAFYSDIHMDPLLAYRKAILPQFEQKFGIRPSVNDFLLKAVALTIREYPMLNAMLKDDEIHVLPSINVGLAVAIPNGLVVPALTDVDQQGISETAAQRKELTGRALKGQLTLEEMDRGTFTVSSLAQFDVTFFTSILNPPQSGILSVGKTRDELSLNDGAVIVKKVATMGVAVDHRIIDGVMAAGFIQTLKAKLENPAFTFMHC